MMRQSSVSLPAKYDPSFLSGYTILSWYSVQEHVIEIIAYSYLLVFWYDDDNDIII
jgi:hypothetical protein